MNKDSIILEGKKLEQLVNDGIKALGKKSEEEVEVDVLEKGVNIGSLNIKKFKVEIKVKKDKINQIEKKESISRDVHRNIEEKENPTTFDLHFESEGVYLSIVKGKTNIDAKKIMQRIEQKEIKDLDQVSLKEIFKRNESSRAKIAPLQDEKLIDARFEIIKSSDNMILAIILYPEDGGCELSYEDVISKLREDIKYGLDEQRVKTAIDEKEYDREIVVARGTYAVDGEDGFIEFTFEQTGQATPYILEDGSVDYRKLNLISNVSKGDLLAVLHAPKEGVDGHNIRGEVIPYKPGIPKHFKYGKNIEVSEDGLKLTSLLDGQVCKVNEKLTVYELYTVEEDVDNSTGDIDFKGNVRVRGSVLTGFNISADGDVEIDGAVEGANIDCGGNLIIKRGIQGYNTANIKAKGNIMTKYVENAKVICGGNLESEAIMHSETISEGNISIRGRKGLLVGGSCKSAKDITARVIGSSMATSTLLEVGLDPRIREKQEDSKKLLTETELDIDKFSKMINHLNKTALDETLSKEKSELLKKSMIAKIQLEKKMNILMEEIKEVDEKIRQASSGKINVEDMIYSGVKIEIGNSIKNIEENLNSCSIYRDKEDYEIKVAPFADN